MKVTVNNVGELAIALIGLAGELPKDINLKNINNRTLQNAISKYKKEMRLKIDKKHNRVRLRSPQGIEDLKNISNDLYQHYMMISNNHNFSHSEKATENLKFYSETTLMMLRNECLIDNISLRYKPNHFGKNTEEYDPLETFEINPFVEDNKIVTIGKATSVIPKNEKRFYTSKYLKHGYPVTHRINLSKISGLLISNENMYRVYCFNDEILIPLTAEQTMGVMTRKIYENAYGKAPAKSSAIIISNEMPKKDLSKLFTDVHTIPNDKNGDFVLQMLCTDNWREKILKALYGEVCHSKLYDGTKDDLPSWELLSCDYSKLQTIKKVAKDMPVNIICFDFQVPLVKKITKGVKTQIDILNNKQKDMLQQLLSAEKI